MLPKEITDKTVTLAHKAGAVIHCSFVESTQSTNDRVLIVFLNGIMTTKSSWLLVMADIIRRRHRAHVGIPAMLAYDRYGQGLTEDRDPKDAGAEPGHGHDVADAAVDLYQLIQQVAPYADQRLILAGNSIGCAIARLYAQEHSVAGVVLLDSVLANSDFDVWPNPDAPDFDKEKLPEDVTVEALKEHRAKVRAIFHPSVANREGLSRRNLPLLLPDSDRPQLKGQNHPPWVTVIGHDFETFSEESLQVCQGGWNWHRIKANVMQGLGIPKSLTSRYLNPFWHHYNEGLVKITEPMYRKGPFQAKGCGHFIQRDDPSLVATELVALVDKVSRENA